MLAGILRCLSHVHRDEIEFVQCFRLLGLFPMWLESPTRDAPSRCREENEGIDRCVSYYRVELLAGDYLS